MFNSKVYSVSQLYGRKIKPTNERFSVWLLQENLENNNLISDVGNINYTKEEKLLATSLLPITEPFCDNIMLVKICGSEDCNGDSTLVKKEVCGSFNSYIRGKFGSMVSAKHGVKAKYPFLLQSNNNLARGTRELIGNNMEKVTNKYKVPVCVPYKVELADVKLENLLEVLPKLLEEFQNEDYYLMDLDVTQDFAGIFNKEEMCKYLTTNFNFCNHGEYRENSNVIVNNDTTVGIDCLTWLTSNARVKIYNKFICQITSPGVNRTIGNHIVDFLHCPDARLKKTFASALAKEHGITRLEATIYNYNLGEHKTTYNPIEDCKVLLENSKIYFQHAPFYSVSIGKMWTKLTKALQNSCCLVFNNILLYVYWGNKNTRKLTGMLINLPKNKREKIINYCISAFSFNCLPTNYIEVVEDPENKDNVQILQKCYLKAGKTYFSRSTTPFSTIPEDIDLENLGLIPTDSVIPSVLTKRVNTTCKLFPYSIKEIDPLSFAHIASTRKRKLEMEEEAIKRRKIDYLEKTIAIKEEYTKLLEKESSITQLRQKMENSFKVQWKNLEPNGFYKVHAFVVNNKGTYTYVGVLVEKDGNKDVCFLKGWHKNIFINACKDKETLVKDGFITFPYNNMDLVCLPTEEPFAEIITNGYTSYQGHTFPKIEHFKIDYDKWKNAPFTQEEMDTINKITMCTILAPAKFRDCKALEDLAEGKEMIITGIKKVLYRQRQRYIILMDNILYRSNYWLEKELEDIDLNYAIKIKLDILRNTPNRNKERLVFCM